MKESRDSRYSDGLISFVASAMPILNGLSLFYMSAYIYFLCVLSPNEYIAIVLISFTSFLPLYSIILVFEIQCRIATWFQRVYPSAIADAYYGLVKFLSALAMFLHAKIIHGFEIHGRENLPTAGGGLILYHHGLLALDIMYITSEHSLLGRTKFSGIIDRFLIEKLAGVCEVFDFYTERDSLVERLKEGYHCSVAPGGAMEGVLSDNYDLIWFGRLGAVEVAKQCGVPVIPMFTVNSQQAMPVATYGFNAFFREVYARTKKFPNLPLICMPVKMRSYLGKPLFCGPDETPAEFAVRVRAAISELRDRHQQQPGNIFSAVLERFGYRPPTEKIFQKDQ